MKAPSLGIVSAVAVLCFAASQGNCGELTVSSALVDFGQVSVTDFAAQNAVMLTNSGSPTTVTGILPTGGGCSVFGAGGVFPVTLGNGQSVQVLLYFDPTQRGTFNCNYTVQDDDPNSDSFQVVGVGTAPFLVVAIPLFPDPLIFGDQPWDGGEPETLLIEIQNQGNEVIQESNFFASLGGAHFSLLSPQFPIAKGASAFVPVIFDPASEGIHNDVVVMGLNNDLPMEPNRMVNVTGAGISSTDVDTPALVTGIQLLGPNPVTSGSRIVFTTDQRGRVKLALFNVAGRLVQTLHDKIEDAGTHEWAWSATAPTRSGVYVVEFTLDGRRLGTSRVVVLRDLQ